MNISGERVSRAHQGMKLTQLLLSEALSTSGMCLDRVAIAKIETGARHVRDMELLALSRVLRVSVQYLPTGRGR